MINNCNDTQIFNLLHSNRAIQTGILTRGWIVRISLVTIFGYAFNIALHSFVAPQHLLVKESQNIDLLKKLLLHAQRHQQTHHKTEHTPQKQYSQQ